jgi:release factor glutamine methyltransferase
MFVSDNSLATTLTFMMESLLKVYPASEVQVIVKNYFYYQHKFSASDLILKTDHKLSESDLLHLKETVNRLSKKEPLAYILGKTEFFGLELEVSNKVLIPRPETEELVAWVLESEKSNSTIADFCTGSGCIALALKSNLRQGQVLGIDISKEALEVAYRNGLNHQLEIKWKELDLLQDDQFSEALSSYAQKLDVIVSNPPYVLESDKKDMDTNVLDFEPGLALFVPDEQPLKFYRSIIFHAQYLLTENGKIYLEIHEDFADETLSLLHKEGFEFTELRKDLQAKNRMIKACRRQF